MGDDIGSGSVTDCRLRSFLTIDDILSSAELSMSSMVKNDLRQQSVTEPEPMSSPINYPA